MSNGDLHVELSGNTLPMVAILGGFTTLFVAIVFATIWLTKLDDRVLQNAQHIAENRAMLSQHAKIMTAVQNNCAKQTFILDGMVKRLDENK